MGIEATEGSVRTQAQPLVQAFLEIGAQCIVQSRAGEVQAARLA